MNAKCVCLISTICLGLCPASALRADVIHSLVAANFNTASTRVGTYPPDAGTRFIEMAPGFSAWASGGQIRLTQGPGYGMERTGGVYAEILKEAKFYQISFPRLKFPMLRPGVIIRDPVRSIQFSIDAKIPAGKDIVVYVAIEPPKDLMPETPWGTRLVLGTLKGTDAFTTYMFKGEDVPEETVTVFINYIRDLQLNGTTEMVGTLVFHINPDGWAAGDGFLFDNVKLQIAGN